MCRPVHSRSQFYSLSIFKNNASQRKNKVDGKNTVLLIDKAKIKPKFVESIEQGFLVDICCQINKP